MPAEPEWSSPTRATRLSSINAVRVPVTEMADAARVSKSQPRTTRSSPPTAPSPVAPSRVNRQPSNRTPDVPSSRTQAGISSCSSGTVSHAPSAGSTFPIRPPS
jgi:hypothetical protein